jgi:histidine triad (HIT) family protein
MKILPLNQKSQERRDAIAARVEALQAAGICPTCRHFETGDVYPPAERRVYYQDELTAVMLEQYPRNPGHSVVLVKPHYEDIAAMPPEVGATVLNVINAAIAALKTAIPAEKVYLVTMCEGARSHLHFQLLPRPTTSEVRGTGVLIQGRGLLFDYDEDIARLRDLMAGVSS